MVVRVGTPPLTGSEPATGAATPDLFFALVLGLTGLTVLVLVLTGLSAAMHLRQYRLLNPPESTPSGSMPPLSHALEHELDNT